MIKVREVVPYIGLNKKWSAAKVEATINNVDLDSTLFTTFGKNFYYDSFYILFPNPKYMGWLKTQ